jgi:hypothetical protein
LITETTIEAEMKYKKILQAAGPLLLMPFVLFAQVNVTNTGILKLSSSTDTLYINGDFTNSSLASLTNNGQLYVKQTLTNDQASMTAGTGSLYLNGGSAQTVGGSQIFKTYNLITNNSSGITLNNDLSIAGTHTFTSGMITTSSTPNYVVYEAGSSYSGDNDTRHVNGWVKKLGSTNFTFPAGSATYERTIALNSLSLTSEFNVKYAAPTPNNFNVQAPLLYIDPNEYWNISKVSGGSALVAMNWDNSKVAFPNWNISDIRVAGFDGTNWVSAGASSVSGSSTTTGNITSNSVSSFNKFTFGAEAFPLPLTLVSFTAKYMGNYTALSWTTVNEENVDHFSVERSDDGVNFYSIVQLPARNSGNREIYSTSDNKTINHIAYYRLQSVDIDGKEKLSRIVVVTVMDKNNSLVLIANPVHDKISLLASDDLKGVFNYTISSINGQVLQQNILSIQSGGGYQLSFGKNIPPGVYSLLISNKFQSFHYKLVVK